MHFLKITIGLGLTTIVAAQFSTLYFTNTPSNVQAGKPVVLKYMAPDYSKPVTIVLRQGPKGSLATLETLTTTATGGSYTWIPAQNLVAATNYALEIEQGDQINYIGPFSLAGGLAFSSTATTAASAVPPSYDASSSSLLSAFSSLSAVLSSHANAALSTMTPSPYASLHLTSGSGVMPVSRNTTFQSATLQPTNTGGRNPTTAGLSTPAGTQSPAATDPTAATGSASSAKISVALIIGAVTAFMHLA